MYVLLLISLFKANAQLMPNSVTAVKAYQMSPKVMFLKWENPKNEFTLTHYDIQFSEITNGYIDSEEYLCSINGNDTQARLPPLPTSQTYRFYIYSIFKQIASKATVVEIELREIPKYVPAKPDFEYTVDRSKGEVTLIWTPSNDFPGNYFYARYKRKSDKNFLITENILTKFDVVIGNLQKDQVYLFSVVACYESEQTISNFKEIHM